LSTSYFTVQWHDTFGHLCCILGYAKDCAADAGLLERKISLSQAIQDLESNSIVCVCCGKIGKIGTTEVLLVHVKNAIYIYIYIYIFYISNKELY
jgi:hypothetical protein